MNSLQIQFVLRIIKPPIDKLNDNLFYLLNGSILVPSRDLSLGTHTNILRLARTNLKFKVLKDREIGLYVAIPHWLKTRLTAIPKPGNA